MTVRYEHVTQLGNRCAENLPMSLAVAIQQYASVPRDQFGSIGPWSDSTTPRTPSPVRFSFMPVWTGFVIRPRIVRPALFVHC